VLRARGIGFATLTHAAGISSTGDPALDARLPFDEPYYIPRTTASAIARAQRDRRRIVAVGTTVVRALESAANDDGTVRATSGDTALLIQPGYRFRAVDMLLTNFHLPKSTLLALVCAFGGTDRVLSAYDEAVKGGYRFYSYGDAMFLESEKT